MHWKKREEEERLGNEEERGNKNELAQGEIDGRRERRVEEEKEWKEGASRASRRRNE